MSPDNVSNTFYNTIDRSVKPCEYIKTKSFNNCFSFSPINQISFGISNLLTNNTPLHKRAPVKQTSWSSIAKKEPLQPIKPTNNVQKHTATRIIPKSDKSKGSVSVKATETALSAGYRFKARNPEPDPRYPADQQLMVGPIPGVYFSSIVRLVTEHLFL